MRIRPIVSFAVGLAALAAPAAAPAQVANQIDSPAGRQLHVFNNQPFALRCRILEWTGYAANWFEGVVPPGVTIWKWVHPANPVQWYCVPA